MNIAAIFKAYDVRGKVGVELTPEVAERIGRATAEWLPERGAVVVGRDMRADSAELATSVITGLRLEGRDVVDIGTVTTDMMYFAIGHMELAGGLMITASHNGSDYNGIKIYRDHVTPVGLDTGLADIRDAVLANDFVPSTAEGKLEQASITQAWIEHALSFVDSVHWPHFKVAIDAGNGMAGAILPHILPVLPLEVEEMYFELDGSFPHHEANPMDVKNLRDIITKIKHEQCHFGLAFDGDGDRVMLVDDLGRPVQGSDMLTLISRVVLQQHPGSEIIHDVRTSRATKEFIQQWGGVPVRAKAGRVSIGKIVRERGAPFGGETTGHLFFADNFDADSGLIGALMAIQAIADSGKKLSELVDEYRTYEMIPETNYTVSNPEATLEKLSKEFADGVQDTLDGLTVEYEDAWCNVRASNTEPLLRLNAEARTKTRLEQLLKRVNHVLKP